MENIWYLVEVEFSRSSVEGHSDRHLVIGDYIVSGGFKNDF